MSHSLHLNQRYSRDGGNPAKQVSAQRARPELYPAMRELLQQLDSRLRGHEEVNGQSGLKI